jgi:hypothetical protein
LRLCGGSSPIGMRSIFMLRRSKAGRSTTQALMIKISRARAQITARAKHFTFATKIG